jgi:hypothetical protein
MKKYVYENATVYISIPTEEQILNIRDATERFAKRLVKKGLIKRYDDSGKSNRGSCGNIVTIRRRAKEGECKTRTSQTIHRSL